MIESKPSCRNATMRLAATISLVTALLTLVAGCDLFYQLSDTGTTSSGGSTVTAAASARTQLRAQAPTASLVRTALSDFTYTGTSCSQSEGRAMLTWIGASEYPNSDGSVTGKFATAWLITIWTDTYNKVGVYGLRYGQTYSTYFGSNSTYFEITRP